MPAPQTLLAATDAAADVIPLYNLTHSIRQLIVQRCETTLSWDQLRSPQISQFLVKPIQQQIRASHFSRATLYALIANCLQFDKEGRASPGNVGVCRSRALIAELLAMRLLKEFSTRELIDALSYDFNPLSGATPPPTVRAPDAPSFQLAVSYTRVARTSTLEVAIRAQAKRFLAHPLVVQHLEAIWAGTIVFHSAADSLHRMPAKPAPNHNRHYGATHLRPRSNGQSDTRSAVSAGEPIRRSVSLYDASKASIFKLSRLRVPRYRQIFSTLSYAIMLGLFLTILVEKSLDITPLEIVFWFWSAGFMLDEVVGFTEQGFGLYILSVWNAFDIGILFLFFVYYVLRLYGIIMEDGRKHHVANMAYDVLASTAVLLFPRLFSVLDHYRYFSQLLIAFRIMAQDLAAILVLIGISCSGFFIAFTLSFGETRDASGIAYALFQILMGFTPAAWERWNSWNLLGKAIMALFLIICHFLVVTILITVLTNSFMAIVQNANDEHQFLFAINTISMVKSESDTLFSYIAPANLIGWISSPLRYCIPFRVFVRINRTIIKVIHFPILCMIYTYESCFLARRGLEPVALVEGRGHTSKGKSSFGLRGISDLFSPGPRLREPSVATYHKDRALAEVFNKPFTGDLRLPDRQRGTSRSGDAIDTWMNSMGKDGGASPPMEQSRSILEQLEHRRPSVKRSMTANSAAARRRITPSAPSNYSDPEARNVRSSRFDNTTEQPETSIGDDADDAGQESDDDGDDEFVLNEEDEPETKSLQPRDDSDKENEVLPPTSSTPSLRVPRLGKIYAEPRLPATTSGNASRPGGDTSSRGSAHQRISSTNTIVFKPLPGMSDSSSSSPHRRSPKYLSSNNTNQGSLRFSPDIHTPSRYQSRHLPVPPSRGVSFRGGVAPRPQRPVIPSRDKFKSAPNLARFLEMSSHADRRKPSFDAIALDLASDIGDNRHVAAAAGSYSPPGDGGAEMLSASFQTQLAMATGALRKRHSEEESNMMSRMVLARMNTIEEGFKDILKEVKEWRNMGSRGGTSRGTSAGDAESVATAGKVLARRMERRERRIVQLDKAIAAGKAEVARGVGDDGVIAAVAGAAVTGAAPTSSSV